MLSRLLQPTQGVSSRRAYSFFSSKSGNGRYFNSARHAKSVTKPTASTEGADSQATALPTNKAADVSMNQEEPVAISSSPSPLHQDTLETHASRTSLYSPPNAHPQPNVPTFHLHNFFSLDRPLLLLDQPSTALFEPSSSQSQAPAPGNFLANSTEIEEDPEADINAARLLARSLVMQRVGSSVDWNAVQSALGVTPDAGLASEEVVQLDSTKRKRRKKMTKHRYKKRRKLQRAERRRLGK